MIDTESTLATRTQNKQLDCGALQHKLQTMIATQINLTSSSTTNARNEQQTKNLEPKNNNGKHTNDQTHIHTAHCQHKQQRQHAHSSLPTCSKTPTTKLPRRTSTPQLSRRNSWQQTLQPTTNSHSTQITRTHGRRTIDRAN